MTPANEKGRDKELDENWPSNPETGAGGVDGNMNSLPEDQSRVTTPGEMDTTEKMSNVKRS